MIIVDVFVPSVDKIYDFSLNENVTVRAVIDEVGEMIGQKERCKIVGDVTRLQLYDRKTQILLDKNKTLRQCGVTTGGSLIFV